MDNQIALSRDYHFVGLMLYASQKFIIRLTNMQLEWENKIFLKIEKTCPGFVETCLDGDHLWIKFLI